MGRLDQIARYLLHLTDFPRACFLGSLFTFPFVNHFVFLLAATSASKCGARLKKKEFGSNGAPSYTAKERLLHLLPSIIQMADRATCQCDTILFTAVGKKCALNY